MGDDGTAVGDELLAVPLPFGFLGLQAENLKGCGAAAHRGDGRTAASIMKAIVQRQSVVGIGAVTTLKGCMDGIEGLPHLIRRPSLPGALGDRHRHAVQQPLVAVGLDVQPAGGRDRQRIAFHAPLWWLQVFRLFRARPRTTGGFPLRWSPVRSEMP